VREQSFITGETEMLTAMLEAVRIGKYKKERILSKELAVFLDDDVAKNLMLMGHILGGKLWSW
jgi:hypothetical protein